MIPSIPEDCQPSWLARLSPRHILVWCSDNHNCLVVSTLTRWTSLWYHRKKCRNSSEVHISFCERDMVFQTRIMANTIPHPSPPLTTWAIPTWFSLKNDYHSGTHQLIQFHPTSTTPNLWRSFHHEFMIKRYARIPSPMSRQLYHRVPVSRGLWKLAIRTGRDPSSQLWRLLTCSREHSNIPEWYALASNQRQWLKLLLISGGHTLSISQQSGPPHALRLQITAACLAMRINSSLKRWYTPMVHIACVRRPITSISKWTIPKKWRFSHINKAILLICGVRIVEGYSQIGVSSKRVVPEMSKPRKAAGD